VLVGHAAAAAPSVCVSVPHPPVVPRSSNQYRRLSASYPAASSSHEACAVITSSHSSSVDTLSTRDADTARLQTLAECQDFIRRLEADSVKQAHEVLNHCWLN